MHFLLKLTNICSDDRLPLANEESSDRTPLAAFKEFHKVQTLVCAPIFTIGEFDQKAEPFTMLPVIYLK